MLFTVEKITLKKKVEVIERKERFMQAGVINFKVVMKNDSYKGFDKSQDVRIEVRPPVATRKVVEYSQIDQQEIKQANPLMAGLDGGGQDDSSDEEDEYEL